MSLSYRNKRGTSPKKSDSFISGSYFLNEDPIDSFQKDFSPEKELPNSRLFKNIEEKERNYDFEMPRRFSLNPKGRQEYKNLIQEENMDVNMQIDQLGDYRVQGIINRFDEFMGNLKKTSDKPNKKDGPISGLITTEDLNEIYQDYSNVAEPLRNRTPLTEKYNWLENEGKTAAQWVLTSNADHKHLALKEENKMLLEEIKLQGNQIEKLERTCEYLRDKNQKLGIQNSILLTSAGIQDQTLGSWTMELLSQGGFGADNASMDIDSFVRENFVLRKYNQDLRALVSDLQRKANNQVNNEEFSKAIERCKELEKEKANFKPDMDRLKTKVAELQSRLRISENRAQSFNAIQAIVAPESAFVQTQKPEIKKKVAKIEGEYFEPSHAQFLREIEKVNMEMDAERIGLVEKIVTLQNQLNKSQKELSEAKSKWASMEETNASEKNALSQKLDRVTKEKQEIDMQIRKSKKIMEQEKQKMEFEFKQRLAQVINRMNENNKIVEKEANNTEILKSELKKAKADCSALQNELKRALEKLNEKANEIQTLKQEAAIHEGEVDVLRSNEMKLKMENERLRHQVKDLQSREDSGFFNGPSKASRDLDSSGIQTFRKK